ncbi:MAG: hypothetical protein CR972_03200 [Candidatus Moraniibacteriota bacterium]|nr:MAG: hypothetical protein CR972_03200 [Candidatus Moranbacteria bacterium]
MERYSLPEKSLETEKFLENYPKVKGRFYHGCPKNVDKLLPPDITGEIRPGEEDRRKFKDVIFLTNDIEKAIEYAGPEGVVFLTNAIATQYKPVASDILNPKKAQSVQDDIYIVLPKNIKVVAKWHKEKGRVRGKSQKYIDEYIGEHENNK